MHTIRIPFILFFLLPVTLYAQRYQSQLRSWKWAATAEAGGVGSAFSVNIEYIPVQFKKSFVTLRGGLGYLGARYSMATVPQSVTWNILLNPNVKDCPPQVPLKSMFAEIGLGGAYLVNSTTTVNYLYGPILGIRRYFLFNERTTGFWKAQISPVVTDHNVIPWGGLAIGIVLD
ncbi:hypothetical protein [Spirosoma sp.]|uniref:hypothetical protein n=1 Tax=Spirosoma sp. TaxID=1899569 RepID=UPI003B3A8648